MDTTQPKYKAIADDLRRRIAADEFEDGTLPGIAALQAHYDAALNTVRGAQDILEKEGLIQRQQGHPTRILEKPLLDEPREVRVLRSEMTDQFGAGVES